MTLGNILRLIENETDFLDFPKALEEFKEHGSDSDYFFFVIENNKKEIIGILIGKAECNKKGEDNKEGYSRVIIKDIYFNENFDKKEKEMYTNTAFSNLYQYIEKIRDFNGNRIFFQVSIC